MKVACRKCGSTNWSQWISFGGTDLIRLTERTDGYAVDVDGRKYNEDGDGWLCENDHDADDDQSEKLDEIRSSGGVL